MVSRSLRSRGAVWWRLWLWFDGVVRGRFTRPTAKRDTCRTFLFPRFGATPGVDISRLALAAMPRPVHWPNPIILPDGLDDTGAPDALVCPITQELMREPCLVTTSGRTYERDAINRWIREHGTDPLQRSNSLRLEDLAPNLAVRQMVEEFARERNGGSLPSQIPREPAPASAPASAPAPPAPAPPRHPRRPRARRSPSPPPLRRRG